MNSPEKLFWSAVDQALSTAGVTRTVSQTDDTEDFFQVTKLRYAGKLQSETAVTLTDKSQGSRVVSETIGQASADFFVYRELETAAGKLSDAAKDKWTEIPANGNGNQFLADALLNTAIFTGNFAYGERHELLNLLRESRVYGIMDFVAKDRVVDGRKSTVISMTLNPTSYSGAMKQYLEFLGLTKIAEEFSADLPASQDVQAEVAIEPASRQFVRFGIPTIDAPNAERFSDWGVLEKTETPKPSISFEQLSAELSGVR